ncbi:MAG: type II toxin-antitoxin system HicB family antitoxin [Desulfitobacteriaceae bacterium]|nr:type II toxin-antitoxin system HicB family antitoxin [Desulfitobacteriaceae bacterium]
MTNKNLDYYLGLPYKYSIYPAQEGGYVIEIPDLPGCISQGETVEEAVSMIEDAKRGWLEVALEQGAEIPEPTAMVSADYSGKFNVRVPKSLHKSLVENAKTENVSLNQLVVYHLSKSIGHRGI